jgi:hypothetical protein
MASEIDTVHDRLRAIKTDLKTLVAMANRNDLFELAHAVQTALVAVDAIYNAGGGEDFQTWTWGAA